MGWIIRSRHLIKLLVNPTAGFVLTEAFCRFTQRESPPSGTGSHWYSWSPCFLCRRRDSDRVRVLARGSEANRVLCGLRQKTCSQSALPGGSSYRFVPILILAWAWRTGRECVSVQPLVCSCLFYFPFVDLAPRSTEVGRKRKCTVATVTQKSSQVIRSACYRVVLNLRFCCCVGCFSLVFFLRLKDLLCLQISHKMKISG